MITKRNIIYSHSHKRILPNTVHAQELCKMLHCQAVSVLSPFSKRLRRPEKEYLCRRHHEQLHWCFKSLRFTLRGLPRKNWAKLECARHMHFTHFFQPSHFFSPSSANGTDSVGSHLSLGNNQQSGIAVDAEDVAQKLRLGQVRRGAECLWRCGANHLKPHLWMNSHSHSPRLPSCQSHNRSRSQTIAEPPFQPSLFHDNDKGVSICLCTVHLPKLHLTCDGSLHCNRL